MNYPLKEGFLLTIEGSGDTFSLQSRGEAAWHQAIRRVT
jgi:hypothetical protein